MAEISKTELKIMQRIWRHEEGMTVAQITEELNDLVHLDISLWEDAELEEKYYEECNVN